MELLGNILGYIFNVFGLLGYIATKRKTILLIKIINDAAFLFIYFCFGQYTGIILTFFNLINGIIFYFRDKYKWAKSDIWLFVFLGINIATARFSSEGYLNKIVVVGNALIIFAYYRIDELKIKLILFPALVLWGIYHILSNNIPSFIGIILSLIANTYSFILLLQQRKLWKSVGKEKFKLDDIFVRDPYFFHDYKTTYLYGTFYQKDCPNGFYCYASNDMENFRGPFKLFEDKNGLFDKNVFWAPEVKKYKRHYYMFATIQINGNQRQSYIFKSRFPNGQFKIHSIGPITPKDWSCLDANLFVENGIPYLIFCREWTEIKDGRIYIARLSKNLKKLAEEPKVLFSASEAKWVSSTQNKDYITDGPFVFKYKNEYKMLWSSLCNNQYALSIISSNDLYSGWKQEETPFYKENGGHGMIFVDEKNQVNVVIHQPNWGEPARVKTIKLDFDPKELYIS